VPDLPGVPWNGESYNPHYWIVASLPGEKPGRIMRVFEYCEFNLVAKREERPQLIECQ